MSNKLLGFVWLYTHMQTHADKQVSRGTKEVVEKTYPKSGKGMLPLVKRSNKLLPPGEAG